MLQPKQHFFFAERRLTMGTTFTEEIRTAPEGAATHTQRMRHRYSAMDDAVAIADLSPEKMFAIVVRLDHSFDN